MENLSHIKSDSEIEVLACIEMLRNNFEASNTLYPWPTAARIFDLSLLRNCLSIVRFN